MTQPETKDAEIPIIDISNPSPEVAQQLLDAASTHGFLFIQNDGSIIPIEDVNNMFDLSARFFQQPTSKKSTHAIHTPEAGGTNRGWVTMAGESLDPSSEADPKEAFNIAPPHPDLQPLPTPLDSSSVDIENFLSNCNKLCLRILTLLGTALQIPPAEGGADWFSSRHDESQGKTGTIFRMLYYPPNHDAQPDKVNIRAGAHSDYGSLTLLFRLPGQPGLEILTPSGPWAPVPIYPSSTSASGPPPILVNIGDLLSFWTRGMLKSTVHRVTQSGGEERYSMAYFCHPLDEARLSAVPSRIIEQFGDKGKGELQKQRERLGLKGGEEVLTAREHLDRRLRVTYGLKE